MSKKTFIEELKEDCKNEEIEINLLNQLKNILNRVAEQWANEIVSDIKEEIKSKAHAGEYKIIKGKKTIRGDFNRFRFNYKVENKYAHDAMSRFEKQDVELEKIMSKIQERKISTIGLFDDTGYDSDDFKYYNYIKMSALWTSKVKRSLSIGQILLGFLTFGIFFLWCFFCEPTYETYGEERIYTGTIKFDYLFTKCCNLVKKKLKEEKIIFEGFRIRYDDYYNSSYYTQYYKLIGDFQNINDEIPIRYIDTKERKKEHSKGEMCRVPILFSILCKVIVE